MSKTMTFNFDWDEVFEGVRQGVIRELAETEFDGDRNRAVSEIKSEILSKIRLTYKDENDLKEEVKSEVKEKVYGNLLKEVSEKYLNQFNEYIETQLSKNPYRLSELESKIKKETSEKLYDSLYYKIQNNIESKMQTAISKLVNSIGGNNVRVDGSDKLITKEDYDELVHKSKVLDALEAGGVDNWEWYSESLKQYFGEDEE